MIDVSASKPDWTQSRWFRVVALIGIYLASASFSHWLTPDGRFVPLWFPAGVTLGFLASSTRRDWPWLLVTCGVVNLFYNTVVLQREGPLVVGFLVVNLARTVTGAWLLQRWHPGRWRVDTLSDAIQFAIIGCVLAPLVSSFLGSLVLLAVVGRAWQETFWVWLLGNATGILVAAPPTMAALQILRNLRRGQTFCLRRHLKKGLLGLALLALLAAVCSWVFLVTQLPIAFLAFPILLGLAMLFEVTGVAFGMVIVGSIFLLSFRLDDSMYESIDDPILRIVLAQSFLLTTGLSFLSLAAALRQRRRLSEALMRMRARLEAFQAETESIFDAIPSLIFFKDNANRILRVNTAAANWFGMSKTAMQNRSVESLHPGPHDSYHQDDLQVIRSGQPKLNYEEQVTLRDGDNRWVITDKIPLKSSSGRVRGLVAVLTDITQRREMEQALAASNRELQRFAETAAHDLKEPLRAVRGYCQFLLEDYAPQLDRRGASYVESAIDGAKRMSQMLEDLLSYTRTDTESVPMQMVDLNEVLQTTLTHLQPQIQVTSAVVNVVKLPAVYGSRTALIQLFQNLISNGLKFVSPGQFPNLQITHTETTTENIVCVCDDGLGIDPSDQQRIFEAFTRLHHRQDFEGTGLGLTICDRVMQRHGGRITVTSTIGCGSRFALHFPKRTHPVEALALSHSTTQTNCQSENCHASHR